MTSVLCRAKAGRTLVLSLVSDATAVVPSVGARLAELLVGAGELPAVRSGGGGGARDGRRAAVEFAFEAELED